LNIGFAFGLTVFEDFVESRHYIFLARLYTCDNIYVKPKEKVVEAHKQKAWTALALNNLNKAIY